MLNLEYEKFYNNVIMCTVWVLYLTLIAFEPNNGVPVGVKTDAFLKKAVPVMRTIYNLIKLKGNKAIKKKLIWKVGLNFYKLRIKKGVLKTWKKILK